MSKEKELILEAKHVTKKFPLTKGKELIANDDVSLKFYKGQTLGIVEAMKLMNEIESDYSGTVAEILVNNQEGVEYGQPLLPEKSFSREKILQR